MYVVRTLARADPRLRRAVQEVGVNTCMPGVAILSLLASHDPARETVEHYPFLPRFWVSPKWPKPGASYKPGPPWDRL